MVQQVTIQNFKSIADLTLELGRINVFIGENGSGKSNILEAIAMGSAAAENKLDNEFLTSRGIRVTEPKAMRSGFEKENLDKNIKLELNYDNRLYVFDLFQDNHTFSHWIDRQRVKKKKEYISFLNQVTINNKDIAEINQQEININKDLAPEDLQLVKAIKDAFEFTLKERNEFNSTAFERMIEPMFDTVINKEAENHPLKGFLLYSPESYFLRRFEDESQITPLGIRGEGLFKLLSVIYEEKPAQFQKIRENLELIDWFEGFEIPDDLRFTERRIRIKDRFLEDGLAYFDQRSSNEGFLYLLFYFSLFISDYTPKFFAIDNIDNAMNPKLASRLVQQLAQLAKEHDKQVIMTTHNPAVLDGLDLRDDEQRLFVISRNKLGHTKALRITHKPTPEGQEPVRLSEQFLRGYIGGLPKNF